MRRRLIAGVVLVAAACLILAGCGGRTQLIRTHSVTVPGPTTTTSAVSPTPGIAIPLLATKNTTRVPGADPVADAAGVALAVFPSAAPGTHPHAVVLAPTDDWEAALAASVLMASPVRAPLLLSGAGSLPAASASALTTLAPTGASALAGAQVIRVGDTPAPKRLRAATVAGVGPFALAAAIDRFATAAAGKPSTDVVVASADAPSYAMPAAGWAAESGDPILFVSGAEIPPATRQALVAHQHPNIYVLGPTSVISDALLAQLGKYGKVQRVSGSDPSANSVAFASYRDPKCVVNQPCVHVPGSFGWALTSPGHGYVVINAQRTLDAAAASALSSSGSFGPQLLIQSPSSLPSSVLNYFLNYATPAYTQEGPTAAVYNHGWMIGDAGAVSVTVQAEVDSLLEVVPQR
jgi:putative cell wall binding repeat protein